MSKKLDVAAITSELSGSAFFSQAASPQPSPTLPRRQPARKAPKQVGTPLSAQAITAPAPEPPTPAAVAIPPVSTPARTPVRSSGRRTITRYAFEFFQDQLETLKRLSLEQQLRGEKGSMSAMVREALDAYITRTLNQAAESTPAATDARTTVRPDGGGAP